LVLVLMNSGPCPAVRQFARMFFSPAHPVFESYLMAADLGVRCGQQQSIERWLQQTVPAGTDAFSGLRDFVGAFTQMLKEGQVGLQVVGPC
jgi:hypothetical protein